MRFFILFLFSMKSIPIGPNTLRPENKDCSYYRKLEDKFHCGPNGYLIHYGLRNCLNFNTPESLSRFSPVGIRFVNCTRSCLFGFLEKMEQDPSTTCNSIIQNAFNSHTDCYLNCNFCQVCKTEKKALWLTYNLQDFLSFRAMKQVVKVLSNCDYYGLSCIA